MTNWVSDYQDGLDWTKIHATDRDKQHQQKPDIMVNVPYSSTFANANILLISKDRN